MLLGSDQAVSLYDNLLSSLDPDPYSALDQLPPTGPTIMLGIRSYPQLSIKYQLAIVI
jgi:hypothetical protein